ncbi:hypothetical protein GCM10020295_44900 [Streptomyces cinereospinus]
MFELLGEEGALEGDGRLALAAFAGSEPFGGLGVVGDVGGEDKDARSVAVGHRGAGEGVAAAVGGLAGLDRAGLAAAQDLVEQGQQAQVAELGEGLAGRFARRAAAEGGGVGVVDVGEAVVGAVDEGDQGGDAFEDRADRQFVDGGGRRGVVGQVFGAGRGDGAVPRRSWVTAGSVRAAARRCVPGSRALQRVKFTNPCLV